jgi:transcriptional regulator with XRE-family HTH domain
MSLAKRIQQRLEALEISEAEACRRAGLAHTYIRDIRKGTKTNPRIDTLRRLAKELLTTAEWLQTGQGDQTIDPDLQRVVDIWDDLDSADHATVRRFVETLIAMKKAS